MHFDNSGNLITCVDKTEHYSRSMYIPAKVVAWVRDKVLSGVAYKDIRHPVQELSIEQIAFIHGYFYQ